MKQESILDFLKRKFGEKNPNTFFKFLVSKYKKNDKFYFILGMGILVITILVLGIKLIIGILNNMPKDTSQEIAVDTSQSIITLGLIIIPIIVVLTIFARALMNRFE